MLPIPAAASEDGSALGGLLVLLFLLLALLFFAGICFFIFKVFQWVMKRRAERTTAMQAYATERGLVYEGDKRLPRVTPLLKRNGGATGVVSGALPGGVVGRLANYQYSTGTGDDRRTYTFSVVLAPLPEVGSARLYCYRRDVGKLFDGIGDALTQYQTVELESEAFSRSFRLVVKDEANMIAIRQLFSPSFIVYLSESVPDGFWFEVEDGNLVGAIDGEHWEEPAKLDALCRATTTVAARIREDVSERLDLRAAASPLPPPPPPAEPPPPPEEPPPPNP